jgi:hypothetical protein
VLDLAVLHEGVVEVRRAAVNVDKDILTVSSANFGNIVTIQDAKKPASDSSVPQVASRSS